MSECPFEAAGWTHEMAARILRINQREREMLFGDDDSVCFPARPNEDWESSRDGDDPFEFPARPGDSE
ncbi:hypothetical protein AUR64_17395 [Haloprofundus marisrubri]|uniref:Uncharacterized protein n=1 Tax=Haloprofundus marisrubri TaxID=1514971 RepID=A0A0W1R581_9EURY|nr:hypothetical protein [Haloprofundus marisrubri]KTG08458.1 hypothetical protein AUR64_17395 [Haloprofundus marisrubri]